MLDRIFILGRNFIIDIAEQNCQLHVLNDVSYLCKIHSMLIIRVQLRRNMNQCWVSPVTSYGVNRGQCVVENGLWSQAEIVVIVNTNHVEIWIYFVYSPLGSDSLHVCEHIIICYSQSVRYISSRSRAIVFCAVDNFLICHRFVRLPNVPKNCIVSELCHPNYFVICIILMPAHPDDGTYIVYGSVHHTCHNNT